MLNLDDADLHNKLPNMSIDDLRALASGIREFLLDTLSRTGGHIGANLGVVELTLALHRVFRSPHDAIVFDTGHQGYVHKILTGRARALGTLNTFGGLSRFLTRAESKHDPIDASHGGTALSLGMGLAIARSTTPDTGSVVCVVGDGSLCEGMSLEALNHLPATNARIILVVNDNGYAISPGSGGIHNALQDKCGAAKALFNSLGYPYIGPIDGHDISRLIEALEEAHSSAQPLVIHVKTTKGFGWPPADAHPYRFHFSLPFNRDSGVLLEPQLPQTYPELAASLIESAMESDSRIVCVTPSTLYATGLENIFRRFPSRSFDPGMAEQHAMGLACGLALAGMVPVIAFQSTFMQRAFDQLIHDVCYHNAPVLILCARSGFSGYDGPQHHGIYDLSYLQCVPNLRVICPKDGYELERMILGELRSLSSPTAVLMPYGAISRLDANVIQESDAMFRRPQLLTVGSDITLVSIGSRFSACQDAVNHLRKTGISAGIINLRYIKPVPGDWIFENVKTCDRLVVVEEAVVGGSIGSEIVAQLSICRWKGDFLQVGLPVSFVEAGSIAELEREYDLDGSGIVNAIYKFWPEISRPPNQ